MTEADFIEFLVMRHGQSTADLEERFEGRWDCELTGKGLAQARRAAEWIARNRSPDRIVASTLRRAQQTAKEIADRLTLPVVNEPDLQERNNGVLAGMKKSEAAERGLLPAGGYLPHESVPGGESLVEFRARAEAVWAKLVRQGQACRRILVVSHGGMIGMLFNCFLGLPAGESIDLVTGDTGMHCWQVGETSRKILFTNRRAT